MPTPFHALKIAQQPPLQIGEDLALFNVPRQAARNGVKTDAASSHILYMNKYRYIIYEESN